MTRRCPICLGETHPVFSKNNVGILNCAKCHHRCADLDIGDEHTSQYYDDDYFTDGADGYVDYLADGPIVRNRARWYAREIAKHGVTPGRLLDVGAAAGFFLAGMSDEGWLGCGLEPNAWMAEHARGQLGMCMRTGAMEALDFEEQFDLVSLIQVMAHLVDPREALSRAAEHTREGGYWLIETWNHRSLTARAFGRSWHQYSPPRTLNWFSPRSLAKLASEFGMIEIAGGRPDKSISGQHAKALLKHAMGESLVAKVACAPSRLIPDRLKIPYFADDLNWRLFQKAR